MEEAVSYIAGKAQDGEAVLLSPACASWGMFPNYEVRGDIFKDCVRKIKGELKSGKSHQRKIYGRQKIL